MAEEEQKSSAGGWLRNIASVFVEMPAEEKETTTPTIQSAPSMTGFVGKSSSTPTYIPPPAGTSDAFVEDLRARFKKILDDKNQPGFDFYEFSMMLLRTSTNPSVDHFKTAYEGAKLMNPNCSQKFLLDSANFYRTELNTAFQTTVQAGEQKKSALNNEKGSEQKQLNTDIANINSQLAQLRQQITALEDQQRKKQTELESIDARFQEKFGDIEQKISATVVAKDGVLNEIMLIENGIKQYLK